jgi:hypothetical protein
MGHRNSEPGGLSAGPAIVLLVALIAASASSCTTNGSVGGGGASSAPSASAESADSALPSTNGSETTPPGTPGPGGLPTHANSLDLGAAFSASRSPGITRSQVLGARPLMAGSRFRASLAVTPSLFTRDRALPFTKVWLVSTSGAVRSLSLASLGVAEPDRPERSVALSPDGRHLAVAAKGELVVLSLTSGAVDRYDIDATQPVGLTWSGDGSGLYYVDRVSSSGSTGKLINLRSGGVTSVEANPVGSSYWLGRGLVHFEETDGSTELRVYNGSTDDPVIRLAARLDGRAVPICQTVCVTEQRLRYQSGRRVVAGLVQFSPETGSFGSALRLSKEQLTFAQVLWGRDGRFRVAVTDSPATYVFDWSPAEGAIVPVLRLEIPGLTVSGAQQQVE